MIALEDRHYDELDDEEAASVPDRPSRGAGRVYRDDRHGRGAQVDVTDVVDEVLGRERDSRERDLAELNRQLDDKAQQLAAERDRHEQAVAWVDDRIANVQAELSATARHEDEERARLRSELHDWYAEKLAEVQEWRRHEATLLEQQDVLRRERRDVRDELAELAGVDALDDLLDGLVGEKDVEQYLDNRRST